MHLVSDNYLEDIYNNNLEDIHTNNSSLHYTWSLLTRQVSDLGQEELDVDQSWCELDQWLQYIVTSLQ